MEGGSAKMGAQHVVSSLWGPRLVKHGHLRHTRGCSLDGEAALPAQRGWTGTQQAALWRPHKEESIPEVLKRVPCCCS